MRESDQLANAVMNDQLLATHTRLGRPACRQYLSGATMQMIVINKALIDWDPVSDGLSMRLVTCTSIGVHRKRACVVLTRVARQQHGA